MSIDAKKALELKLKFQQYGWLIEPEYDEATDVVTVYGTHGKKHAKLFIYKKGDDQNVNI